MTDDDSQESTVRLARFEIDALIESMKFSRLAISSSTTSPPGIRQTKLAELDRIAQKLSAAR